jgi:hypothetical protein
MLRKSEEELEGLVGHLLRYFGEPLDPHSQPYKKLQALVGHKFEQILELETKALKTSQKRQNTRQVKRHMEVLESLKPVIRANKLGLTYWRQ